jgi:RNA polymerase sigma-70 factor (ECF subfamily)
VSEELGPEKTKALIARIQEGDRQAFEVLVKSYMQRAYYVALGFLRNHDDALDTSQEAFVRVLRNIHRFHAEADFFPWLYQIVKNLSLNLLRKRATQKQQSLDTLVDDAHVQFASPQPNARDICARNETHKHLWAAIERLKPQNREIVMMNHFHHMTYQEIAHALGIPIGTVMSRLYYARRELRDLMKDYLDESR